jgi:hypothetical protein
MVADNGNGRLGGAGMGAAVQQEQAQPAQDQQNRAESKSQALPGAVAGDFNFIIHGKNAINQRALNAAEQWPVAGANRKISPQSCHIGAGFDTDGMYRICDCTVACKHLISGKIRCVQRSANQPPLQ